MPIKVSIIIPIYNVASYIEQCLQSVASQTYEGEIECLLIDDCGTDDSMDICKRFIMQYEGAIRFRLLHHDHNRGLSAARNTGIDAAQGEYIFFLDSDDWIYPECIEILSHEVRLHPGVDMVQGEIQAEESEMNQFCHRPSNLYHVHPYYNDRKQCRFLMHSRHLNPMMQNRLLRADFIKRNRLYCKEGIIHEDELWTLKASKYICSIAYCAKDTYYYRTNPDGITSNIFSKKSFDSLCIMADDILSNISLGPAYKHELVYAFVLLRSAENRYHMNATDHIKRGKNPILRKLFDYYTSEDGMYHSYQAKLLRVVYRCCQILTRNIGAIYDNNHNI